MFPNERVIINARYIKKNEELGKISYLFDSVTEDNEFLSNTFWVNKNLIASIAGFKEENLTPYKYYDISGVGMLYRPPRKYRKDNKARIKFLTIVNIKENRPVRKRKRKKKKKLLTCKYCNNLNVYHIEKKLYFCGVCGQDFYDSRKPSDINILN